MTVVLEYRAADIAAVIHPWPVHMLHNPDYQHGMTTSVQVALRDITPIPDAYLLALVDQPHIAPELIRQLLTAFVRMAKGMVIPTYHGKRGHPIILPRAIGRTSWRSVRIRAAPGHPRPSRRYARNTCGQ